MEGNVKEGCNQQRAQGTTTWSSRRRSADLVTLLRMSYSVLPRWEHLGLTDLLTSFPGDSVLKNPLARAADARDMGWIKKIPRRRKWQRTLVFLPEKSHGYRSLVDYSP